MVNLGLLFALSAPVAALGLPMAFVLAALILVYLFDRNIKPAVAQHHGGLTLLLQSSKCRMMASICSRLWAAFTLQRSSVMPAGAAGGRIDFIHAQRDKLAPYA